MGSPPAVDTDSLAAIARLTKRVRELEQQLAEAQERNFELHTARDFADTDAAGYVDRTGVEA